MNGISAFAQRPGKIAAPPPRRSGLTDADITRARRTLPGLGSGWVLDRHEDYDRVVSLVITAVNERDDTPAFILHAEQAGFAAGMVLNDRYVPLGRYDRIEAAMRAIGAAASGERPLAA